MTKNKIVNLRGEEVTVEPMISTDDCIEEMVKDLVESKANIETLIFLGVTKDGVSFVQTSPLSLPELMGYLEMAKYEAMLGDFE